MTRRPVPPERLDEAARLIAEGGTIHAAATAAGIAESVLYRRFETAEGIRLWATKRASPEVREETTIRQRVAATIAASGPFDDIDALYKAVREPNEMLSFASVVGSVWSLQKQGEVAFAQSSHTPTRKGHGPGDGTPIRIRALPALYRRLGQPEPGKTNGHDRRPVDRPIPAPGIVTPDAATTQPVGVDGTDHFTQPDETFEVPKVIEPVEESYPLLASIRERMSAARNARAASALIEAAAELLSPDEKDRLLSEALQIIERHDLSPVEEEYARFAEAHDAVAG